MACLLVALFSVAAASDLGATFGDGAISQILRHAASKALDEPRVVDLILQSKENPNLPLLFELDHHQIIDYRNLSIEFHCDTIHLFIDGLSIVSRTHFPEIFWPLGLGNRMVDVNLKVPKSRIRVAIDESSVSLTGCEMRDLQLVAGVDGHWLANLGVSFLASMMEFSVETVVCRILKGFIGTVKYDQIAELPVYELLPEKAKHYLMDHNATILYRMKNVHVEEKQLTVQAEVEWADNYETDAPNSTIKPTLNVQLRGPDMVTFWIEDVLINNLLSQVEWNFSWLDEKIPVNSPILPDDSRDFLSTLFANCYFHLTVAAQEQPIAMANKNSLVFEMGNLVHLQVVNPSKNISRVFISLIFKMHAEVRPFFDNGAFRIQMELLDNAFEMLDGAYPKTLAYEIQEFLRDVIMKEVWPNIRNVVEEFSYGHGLRISTACGVDPTKLAIELGEGTMSLSSRLLLTMFDPEACIHDLKNSLPNTSKILGQLPF